MSLVGKDKPVSWYSLSKENKGSLRMKQGETEEFFDWLEGVLVGIEPVTDQYEGRDQEKYLFKFEDPAHSQTAILKIGVEASAARGLLAALWTIPDDDINMVRVRPYASTEIYEGKEVTFVNVDVSYRKSPREPWVRLIDLEETTPLYRAFMKRLPDDADERRKMLDKAAAKIKKRLNSGPTNENEYVDKNGEVFDGKKASDDLYEPGQTERKAPVANSNIDEHAFDDLDDDLPF